MVDFNKRKSGSPLVSWLVVAAFIPVALVLRAASLIFPSYSRSLRDWEENERLRNRNWS